MNINKDKLKTPFIKGHANGNDFIFIFKEDIHTQRISKKFIINICNRHTGVGADGLFVLSKAKNVDFKLDYYNSDGTWETLCANGSRCAVLIMNKMNKINNTCTFLAGDGTHSARILKNGLIKMSMNTPKYKSHLISPEGFDGYFIDSGAKHFVCHQQQINEERAYEVGKKIRFSTEFFPKGVNVNFFNLNDDKTINVLTYEKGVEKIMQSCASGSTAVVFHLAQNKKIKKGATTFSPGGKLVFSFDRNWTNIHVAGSAHFICSGNYFK